MTERAEGFWWVRGRGRWVVGEVGGADAEWLDTSFGRFGVDDPSIEWGPYLGKEPWHYIEWHRIQQARGLLERMAGPEAAEVERLLFEAICTWSHEEEKRPFEATVKAAHRALAEAGLREPGSLEHKIAELVAQRDRARSMLSRRDAELAIEEKTQ